MYQIKHVHKGVQSWGLNVNITCQMNATKGIEKIYYTAYMVICISGDVCVCTHEWLCVYEKNIYMYILAHTCFLPQSEYLHYPFDVLNIFCF